jgi:hypothetical protein
MRKLLIELKCSSFFEIGEIFNILFVCTDNFTRSVIFRKNEISGFQLESTDFIFQLSLFTKNLCDIVVTLLIKEV